MKTYRIEKNVPIPWRKLAGHFPVAEMEAGDSFALNGELPQTVGYLASVFARRQVPKWKFKVIKTDTGYRCWRID